MMKFLTAATLVTGLIVNAAGCEPVKAPPVPGLVAIAGDSVIWQATLYGQDARLMTAETDGMVFPGTEPYHAQAQLSADVADAAKSPDVSVVAFGQNMADVYGSKEKSDLFRLANTPTPSSCVVLVEPSRRSGEAGVNVDRVRLDLETIAQVRPHTQLVDWNAELQGHADYLGSDSVHLAVPPGEWATWAAAPYAVPAAQAFMAMVWRGVDQCNQEESQ